MSPNQNLRRRTWEKSVTDQSKVHPPIVDFKGYVKNIEAGNLTKEEQNIKLKIEQDLDKAIQPFSHVESLIQG